MEGEGRAAVVGGVEFGAVGCQGAAVVDFYFVAWSDERGWLVGGDGVEGDVWVPLADLREHSVECSICMSRGLSNAETLATSSVIAADTEERRIVVVCVTLLYCMMPERYSGLSTTRTCPSTNSMSLRGGS